LLQIDFGGILNCDAFSVAPSTIKNNKKHAVPLRKPLVRQMQKMTQLLHFYSTDKNIILF
jgi:hypothetical protein